MAFRQDDRRLPPLGDSFITFEVQDDEDSQTDDESASNAVQAVTLRRSRSFPGYIPYCLNVLSERNPPHLHAGQSRVSPIDAWPDTDYEGEEYIPNIAWMDARQLTSVGHCFRTIQLQVTPSSTADSVNVVNVKSSFSAWADLDDEETRFSLRSDRSVDDMLSNTDDETLTNMVTNHQSGSEPLHLHSQTMRSTHVSLPDPELLRPSVPFRSSLQRTVRPTKGPHEGREKVNEHPLAFPAAGPRRGSPLQLELARMTSPQASRRRQDDHHLSIGTLLARCCQQSQSALGTNVAVLALARAKEIIGSSTKSFAPKGSRASASRNFGGNTMQDSNLLRLPSMLDTIMKEQFTTIIIRNLPGTLSQSMLLAELDRSGFEMEYDFCYMPSSSSHSCDTKGYAFTNFVSADATAKFVSTWHGTHRFGMRTDSVPLDISIASVQGLEANVAKWKTRTQRVKKLEFCPFVR